MHELPQRSEHVPLATVAVDWGRIGCTGFGGPPTHIALLRRLCVERRGWLDEEQFERALAAANLLPGPSSTQLAIYCAWRAAGPPGAILGGLAFIVPGLVAIIALSLLFLAGSPPDVVLGAGAGAGAAVAAVAVRAGLEVAGPIVRRAAAGRIMTFAYGLAGAVAAALAGAGLVLVLIGCGAIEVARRGLASRRGGAMRAWLPLPLLPAAVAAPAGLGALAWTSLKVGALSFGGGFVIIPLMQADAVTAYHWMTHAQFLNAVALGQITPGPVVHTVAAVGYAADGIPGALFAAAIAFAPSFVFVLAGARHFDALLQDGRARAFLAGAGPAAAGAIIGAAIPLATSISELWQALIATAAAVALLVLRRGIVPTLLAAGAVGGAVALLGGPLPN
jgi:chromate transporter